MEISEFVRLSRGNEQGGFWHNCGLIRNHETSDGRVINVAATREALDLAFGRLGIDDLQTRCSEDGLARATAALLQMHREGWPHFRGEPANKSPLMGR